MLQFLLLSLLYTFFSVNRGARDDVVVVVVVVGGGNAVKERNGIVFFSLKKK